MTNQVNSRKLLSDAKFFEGYSRWNDSENRYETWEESVDRVMETHKQFYGELMTPELLKFIDEATDTYKEKRVLGAQRALQFGGEQLLKNHLKLYNCVSSYVDRPSFFQECIYMLLSGAGAGFSVQKHHVEKLPPIQDRKKNVKLFTVEDSIEGWADALGVLMSSFFVGGGTFPEYEAKRVYFDLSKIRPKGAKISGGFKAPGPEPLRKALDKIEYLLVNLVKSGVKKLRPIDAYDIVMHSSDAVLAGGVRRSATIALFSHDDDEMINAKTGNWNEENPQRARSNNSAVIIRDEITAEEFSKIMKSVKEYGEPGFVFSASRDFTYNPCVEIGKLPIDQETGMSGWQGCNLAEINGGMCFTKEDFFKACRAGAILGTLQAGYTSFPYLGEVTERIFKREALLGVSITGWMNNPKILFDEDTLREGARIIKKVNRKVAKLLNINPAARTTCVKPSGNASTLLMTASGIHTEWSKRYFRVAQMNKESEVAQLIKKHNPYMIEESVWSANNSDYCVFAPIVSPKDSIFKEEMYGVKLLEKVKLVQNTWIEEGTDVDLCVDPRLRHNVSNTVTVLPDQWDEVEKYVFENRYSFAGISFLSSFGDKDYAQAPFTEVLSEQEVLDKYGVASYFASGLIVDGLKVFSNLWRAIDVSNNYSSSSQERLDNQQDWIRRFHKFSKSYFDGDTKKASYCLKDVYLIHKWEKIQNTYKDIDFVRQLESKKFTEVDTLGAIACSGGACEVQF
jgi:ribonucleoside-diphosphate reductase alpha chain